MFDTIRFILDLVLLLGVYFVVQYLRKLPDQIHQKNLKVFELELNKKLELFKIELNKEIELLKIKESQLYIHKAQQFMVLSEIISNLLDKTYQEKLQKDPDTQKEFYQKMLNLGTNLFFFASDEPVKKYVEFYRYGQKPRDSNFDQSKLVILLAELMVLIRKDLGYKDTACNIDDFLNIKITDWEDYKKQHGL